MSADESPAHTPNAVAVGVAVRDPNVREVLLGLLRLNRMRARGVGAPVVAGIPLPQIEVGAPSSDASLLVGYVASPADAEFFRVALHSAGDPPSVILIPPDADPHLVEQVEQMASKVVRLPDGAQAIANAIRAQLPRNPGISRPHPGASDSTEASEAA
jgi:hypothetical protein